MAAGRYAPSPTGALHVGNLRTALVAWLAARSTGSRFAMRIDDLDPVASSAEHEVGQLADLRALGLDWDEPVVRSSDRRAAHEDALAALVDSGRTFCCYCTRREIREAAAAPHGEPARYPGTCRSLTDAERAEREAEGRPAALRLRADGTAVTIHDRRHGDLTAVVDDIVLRRNDGVPAYHVAVVVDDDDEGVEEVVRGDDLLDATPSQAHLLDLLGRPRPSWAHVPLVVGTDGARLAKRHGSVTLADLAAEGIDGPTVVGHLTASLGLAAPGDVVDLRDLATRFDPAALPRSPWVWTPPAR
jgi:glutamyl-tRNA synthetase